MRARAISRAWSNSLRKERDPFGHHLQRSVLLTLVRPDLPLAQMACVQASGGSWPTIADLSQAL